MCILRSGRVGLRLLFALVALSAGTWSVAAPRLHAGEAVQPEAKKRKLDELLKERLATVREMARLIAQRVKNGQGSLDQMRDANRMLFQAELALCDSDKDRALILEKSVVEARSLEKIAETLVKAGQDQASGWLAAKADRLQTEIALERVRAKMALPAGTGQTTRELHDQVARWPSNRSQSNGERSKWRRRKRRSPTPSWRR